MDIIPYSPADHSDLVAAWWRHHRGTVLQVAMLPPAGVVAVDDAGPCAALWLHLSVGIGVGFLENPVARPGMRLADSRKAFLLMMECLEDVALTHDYGVLVVHPEATMCRVLEGYGYHFATNRPVYTGIKPLR